MPLSQLDAKLNVSAAVLVDDAILGAAVLPTLVTLAVSTLIWDDRLCVSMLCESRLRESRLAMLSRGEDSMSERS